jgi:hypothetical protein
MEEDRVYSVVLELKIEPFKRLGFSFFHYIQMASIGQKSVYAAWVAI